MIEQTPKELLETEVINRLLHDQKYFDIVYPFLKQEYFSYEYSIILKHIDNHFKKYSKPPKLKELVISFKDSSEKEKEVIKTVFKELKEPSLENVSEQFLLDSTEMFIKRKIFEKAIITGAEALGSSNSEKYSESFALAEESIKVTLESDIGIMFNDIDKLDFTVYKGLLTGIPSFDKVLNPGFIKGTLNCPMAPSGIGKTAALIAFMCEFAKQGEDIVFISMEQSEAEIYKRIYANLLDIEIDLIHQVDKEVLKQRIQELESNPGFGKIVVKQYPAKALSPLGISSYLDKIQIETGIKEPVLIVDYLGLLKSDLMKNMDNSYAYIGSIAEELRALAINKNLIAFSPMQLNRSAYNNLEAGSETMSDSMKVMHTLDSAFLILQTPEMKNEGNLKIVFTKNRYSGITTGFDIKFDYKHFRFVDKFFINGENITEQQPSGAELENFTDKMQDLML